jgi:hypothetical protein
MYLEKVTETMLEVIVVLEETLAVSCENALHFFLYLLLR